MKNLSTSLIKLPPEQQAIRDKCFHPSGGFEEFTKEEIEQSIPDRFEKIVAKNPDRTAVKTKNFILTYGELNETANRIARAISEKCGRTEEPIAVLLDNDTNMIATILGVLKAGKLCLLLDLSSPQARIQAILNNSLARLIVTNNVNFSLAEKLANDSLQLIDIDNLDPRLSHEDLGMSLSPDALAAVLYTSGSTGEPKGAVYNHRNLLHDVRNYTNSLHICADDRLLILSAYRIWDIFRALLNGAALLPFHFEEKGLTLLASWLINEEITVYHSVPSAFRYFVDTLTGKEEFPKIRLIHLGGEPVSKREVELFKKHFAPGCILLNNIGSTETTIFRQYLVDKDTLIAGNVVPVGYAVEDKEILLLDDDGGEVGFNQVGEIAVKSRYISRGYWRRPDLTNVAFLQAQAEDDKRIYRTGDLGRMRPDGCLDYLGRKDLRVKIRGYRVEVGEVEMALLAHPSVKEAVVAAQEREEGEPQLAAYLLCKAEEKPTARELREFLTRTLPEHMIPAAFVSLDTFPLTPTGKVDRKALPKSDGLALEAGEEYVAPRTAMEKLIAEVWQGVLGVGRVGVHDKFFDLGGHSLLSVKAITRVEKKTGQRIHPREMILQTVGQLAAACEQQGSTFQAHASGGLGGKFLNMVKRVLNRG